MYNDIVLQVESYTNKIIEVIATLQTNQQIAALNRCKELLHNASPLKNEPIDFVRWVESSRVEANDYNPNVVAPPEMELLYVSIKEDGYTQPIVAMPVDDTMYEVIDGFHRTRIGKERPDIANGLLGYLPVVAIRSEQYDRGNRIASTIRHNRARGKHRVDAMTDIVVELKRRNWTNERIAKNLGMDQDEILRLCQISGLAELFGNCEFSRAWNIEGEVTESDFKELSDDIETYGEIVDEFRTVNTSDEDRIFHTHDKWECYRAGFYKTSVPGMTKEQCENAYRDFLGNDVKFREALEVVILSWKHSCEHYLTNKAMNRIAWLGQAAACAAIGIPAMFRGGFNLLTEQQQNHANDIALEALNRWLTANGRTPVTMGEAVSYDRQSVIY